MKKILAVVFILFIFCSDVKSQAIYSCNNGEMSFFSKSPMENIDATSKSMNSFINISNREIVFIIPMRSFKFKKALMEEHFNEKYVESDKYPNASYKGTINENIDFTKDSVYKVTATGKLTVHGVEKERTENGTLTVSKGTLTLTGEFFVALKDHNIEIPKLLMENIADTVKVNFTANYNPFKK